MCVSMSHLIHGEYDYVSVCAAAESSLGEDLYTGTSSLPAASLFRECIVCRRVFARLTARAPERCTAIVRAT